MMKRGSRFIPKFVPKKSSNHNATSERIVKRIIKLTMRQELKLLSHREYSEREYSEALMKYIEV